MGETEGQLSQVALDTLEALGESKARGEFLPKGFSLVAVVHLIPFFRLTE